MMNFAHSVQVEQTNGTISVSRHSEPFPHIDFTIQQLSPQHLKYSLKMTEKEIFTLFQGCFQGIDSLYLYIQSSQFQKDAVICQPAGKIKIKNPSIHPQQQDSTEYNDYFTIQARLINTPTIEQRQSVKYQDNIIIDQQYKLQEKSQDSDNASQTMKISSVTYVDGNESTAQIEKFAKEELLCYHAIKMIKEGINTSEIAEKLNISLIAAKKMHFQFRTKSKIILPKGPRPTQPLQAQSNQFTNNYQNFNQNQMIAMESFNGRNNPPLFQRKEGPVQRLPNQTAQKIRKILLQIVKEDKMQSYQQMQQYLSSIKIERSLSSIYRYISSIKSTHSEFKNRNFAMHKKDVPLYYPSIEEENINRK